jgi:hypothetical protein
MTAAEKRQAVRDLADGKRSAGEIAAILGISRNAVIGVVHRARGRDAIQLSDRVAAGRAARRASQRRKRIGQRRRSIPNRHVKIFTPDAAVVDELEAAPAWRPLEGSTPVGLLDRTGCKWPVTVSGQTLFCNCELHADEKNYCPAHRAAYTRKKP